jgi:4-amino-4-deoxy-L-arabinose transferase-like glycosyltransferase
MVLWRGVGGVQSRVATVLWWWGVASVVFRVAQQLCYCVVVWRCWCAQPGIGCVVAVVLLLWCSEPTCVHHQRHLAWSTRPADGA